MLRKHYHAIIIGAGPSGSSAAFFLKNKMDNVLLIDKAKFPRDKLCGGALSKKTIEFIQKHFKFDRKVLGPRYDGGIIYHCDELIREVHSEQYYLHICERKEFDYYLVQQAVQIGVEFVDGVQYIDLNIEENSITIDEKRIKFDILVGADGIPSKIATIAYLTGRTDIKKGNAVMAYETYVKTNKITLPQMYFGVINYGYAWAFPNRKSVAVGIGGVDSKNDNARELFTRFYQQLHLEENYKLKGHWLPYGRTKKHVAKGNVFLVGDAAGFADPLFGEGIYYSLLSGKLLADAMVEKDIKLRRKKYTNLVDKYIRKELFYAWILRNFLFKKFFMKIVFTSLSINSEFAEYTMGLMSGSVGFREFFYHSLRRTPLVLLELIKYKLFNKDH